MPAPGAANVTTSLLLVLALVVAPATAVRALDIPFEPVDTRDNVGEYLWLAFDTQGRPHLSYYNRTNGTLRFAVRESGVWATTTIDGNAPGVDVGGYTYLAFDPNGDPHITYYDWTDGDLEHAWRVNGVWSTETIDTGGVVGRYSNFAFDGQGTMHVVYYDEQDGDLQYARNDASGWQLETIDSAGDVGIKTRMVLDSAGFVHAAYYDATNTALKYARRTVTGWETLTVDDGLGDDVGSYASILLDADGHPWITHYNATTGNPEIAVFDGQDFVLAVVDDSPDQTGFFTSLQFDAGGRPVVAYFNLTQGKPTLARRVGGVWTHEFLEPTSGEGRHVALVIDPQNVLRVALYNEVRGSLRYGEAQLPVQTERTGMGALRARYRR